MISMRRIVTTSAPTAAVFNYLADFTNAERWDPNAVRVARVSGDGGVGTVYRVASRFAGRVTELEYRVVDLEPGSLIRLRGQKKAVTAVDTISVEAHSSGTSITYAVEFSFHGVFAILAPLLRPAVRRLGDQGAAGLAAELAALVVE